MHRTLTLFTRFRQPASKNIRDVYFYSPDIVPEQQFLNPLLAMSAAKARGRGPTRGRHGREETVLTKLSKTISWVLRHGAGKTEGVNMRPDGYVRVEELASFPAMLCMLQLTMRLVEQQGITPATKLDFPYT